MGVISYEVPINAQRMTIGVQGENNVREFLFDVTEWRQITGNLGAAEMVVQRAGDSSPYAAVITMKDENTVSWIPTSTDTEKVGAGKIELMWITNNQTVKTKIFLMKVDPSLDYAVPDDSLDPWASWMPNLINADARVKSLESEAVEIQSGLTQEISERKNGDTLLGARIDGIIAPAGEAPSAAEMLDARVGLDSSTFASLGEAIRGQVSDIKTSIYTSENAIEYAGGYRPISFIDGSYSSTAQTIVGNTIYHRRESTNTVCALVQCEPGDVFKLNIYGPGGIARSYMLCDENLVVQSCSADYTEHVNETLVIPDGIYYVAFNNSKPRKAENYYVVKGFTPAFKRNGYMDDDARTKISNFLRSGWYGSSTAKVAELTDLPEGVTNAVTLFNFPGGFAKYQEDRGNSNTLQVLMSTMGDVFYRTVRSQTGIVVYDWKPLVSYSVKAGSYWSEKSIGWNGDSISYGSVLTNVNDAYPYLTAKQLNASITNYAIGGSTIAKQDGTYESMFFSLSDFNNATKDTAKSYLVKDSQDNAHPYALYSYINGEWTRVGHSSAVTGRVPIVDRVQEMDLTADLIVIAAGTNDFYYNWTPFGDFTSRDKTTFYGALHNICKYLCENSVNKTIVFVTPIKRVQHNGETSGTWDYDDPSQTNSYGKTLLDYGNAIKEVCGYYSIPVLDLYSISGMNPALEDSLFGDTIGNQHVHPNVDGHLRLSTFASAFLDSLR